MELRQLRYYVAVAEELHFRRAAARLHMSQPPLSQQIRQLEEELGCLLLARTRRRVELTPAGEAFLRDARAILAELDGAVATARRIDAGQSGRLRIGFVGSALVSLLPGIVQRFRAARPNVEVELRERSTIEQVDGLARGLVDVGLVPLPVEEDDLHAEVLLRERTIAALPAGHPLARLRRVPLGRLAAEPFVMFPRAQAPGFHDRLIASLTATGSPPRIVQNATEMQTIVGLVATGIGVSLVPASVEHLALQGVAYRPVTGGPVVELAAITRSTEDSPVVHAFLELARELRDGDASPAATPD
jgi:DNA-binding transcriptional LysR family regulator